MILGSKMIRESYVGGVKPLLHFLRSHLPYSASINGFTGGR